MPILDREIKIIPLEYKNNPQLERECNDTVAEYKENGFYLGQLAINNGGIILVFIKAPVEEIR